MAGEPRLTAPYSFAQAAADLLGGAGRGRRPVRRLGGSVLPFRWQIACAGLTGIVMSLDILMRDRTIAADMPAGFEPLLPAVNWLVAPAFAAIVGIGSYGVATLGCRLLLRGRRSFALLGTAAALGGWSAVLPLLATIAMGLVLDMTELSISFATAVVALLHTVPALAEAADLTIARAFLVNLFGVALVFLVLVSIAVSGGFVLKAVGVVP